MKFVLLWKLRISLWLSCTYIHKAIHYSIKRLYFVLWGVDSSWFQVHSSLWPCLCGFSMQYESICLHWWKIIAKQTNHLCHIEQASTPGAQQLDSCRKERQTDTEMNVKKETNVKEGNRRGSEQSGVVFALYMQSVKKWCVRETNAVRLKVTTECTERKGESVALVEVCQMETHFRNIRRRHLGACCCGTEIIIAWCKKKKK